MKKWITSPNFIYGIVFGLAFSVLAGFLILTEVFTFGLLGLVGVFVFFSAGAVVGSLSARMAQRKVAKKASQLLPRLAELSVDLSFDAKQVTDTTAKDDVQVLVQKHSQSLRELLSELSEWGGTLYLRMVAMGALFTMLGLLISFAVFWATFLQVTRLEQQIEATKTAKQVDIALSIASNYRYLVNGFIDDISSSPSFGRGNQYLSRLHYKRLESTLRQLKPYIGIDVKTGELADVPNSPEQSFLLQYLSTSGVLLPQSKIQLHQLAAHHLDIRHAELSSVDFLGSDLRGSQFYKTVLTKANFHSTILHQAAFQISSLNGADFTQAQLQQADFTGADLTHVSFKGANLRGVNLQEVGGWKTITSMQGADITGVLNAPEGFVEWALAAGAVTKD